MKQLRSWAALSALLMLCLAACEKDENQDPNAPFIESLELSGDTLFIKGDFGATPGSVVLNGQTAPQGDVLGWSEKTIICLVEQPIPEEIEVEIIVEGKKSNRKKITRNTSSQMRIDYLLVDEMFGTLLIYGQFPNQQGTVKVNNIPIEVTTWSSAIIISKIPQDGDASYGEVTVTSGGKSAKRHLYEWSIIFECIRPQSGITGFLEEVMAAQVYIRGDRGPVPPNVFIGGYPEMYYEGYCTYRTGGITSSNYDCGTITAEWGEVDMFIQKTPGFKDLTGETRFQARKTHRPDGFDINLDIEFWNVIPAKVTTTPCSGAASVYQYTGSSDLVPLSSLEDLPLRFEPGSNNFRTDSITELVSSSAKLIWNAEDTHFYLKTAKLKWTSDVYDKP